MQVYFSPRNRQLFTILALGRVRSIWSAEGTSMIHALEKTSYLQFRQGCRINVGVQEGSSWTGRSGHPGTRAILICPPRYHKHYNELIIWLLYHELGHRLLEQNNLYHHYQSGLYSMDGWTEAEHRLLFLFLIDVLEEGLGKTKASLLIKHIPTTGYFDTSYAHTRAWQWAKKRPSATRSKLMQQIVVTHDLALLNLEYN